MVMSRWRAPTVEHVIPSPLAAVAFELLALCRSKLALELALALVFLHSLLLLLLTELLKFELSVPLELPDLLHRMKNVLPKFRMLVFLVLLLREVLPLVPRMDLVAPSVSEAAVVTLPCPCDLVSPWFSAVDGDTLAVVDVIILVAVEVVTLVAVSTVTLVAELPE